MKYLPAACHPGMDQLAPKQCVNVDNHRVTAEVIWGRAQGRAVEQQPGWETAVPRIPQDLAITECSMIWLVDSLVKLHNTVTAAPLQRAVQVSNPGLPPEAYRPVPCPRVASLPQNA